MCTSAKLIQGGRDNEQRTLLGTMAFGNGGGGGGGSGGGSPISGRSSSLLSGFGNFGGLNPGDLPPRRPGDKPK